MKDRMSIWALVCKALGWFCILGGVISAFFTVGVTLSLIPIGIVLLLNSAIFEWMDGVTEQLIENRGIMERQLSVLERIEDKLIRSETDMPTDEPPHDTEPAAGRRRAQRQTETEVVEQAHHGFDPQNVADIYRLSQKLKK